MHYVTPALQQSWHLKKMLLTKDNFHDVQTKKNYQITLPNWHYLPCSVMTYILIVRPSFFACYSELSLKQVSNVWTMSFLVIFIIKCILENCKVIYLNNCTGSVTEYVKYIKIIEYIIIEVSQNILI